MVIGQQKGHATNELMEHNFGMAEPEGYRITPPQGGDALLILV